VHFCVILQKGRKGRKGCEREDQVVDYILRLKMWKFAIDPVYVTFQEFYCPNWILCLLRLLAFATIAARNLSASYFRHGVSDVSCSFSCIRLRSALRHKSEIFLSPSRSPVERSDYIDDNWFECWEGLEYREEINAAADVGTPIRASWPRKCRNVHKILIEFQSRSYLVSALDAASWISCDIPRTSRYDLS
jgi:hypothetical protein